MSDLHWHSAEITHVGNRRKVNEDAVLARPDARLWAVADGMGGHHAGDRASREIIAALKHVKLSDDLARAVDSVEDCLVSVNDALRAAGRTEFSGQTIGSTVVTFINRGGVGVVLWAGDSRLYRLRGQKLEQITCDHNPVCDLLDSGGVTEEEALAADTNVITRAVGGHRDLHLDVAVFDVADQDAFILCSDGLYREVEEHQLAGSLLAEDYSDIAGSLLDDVLSGEASDNVSFILLRASTQTAHLTAKDTTASSPTDSEQPATLTARRMSGTSG